MKYRRKDESNTMMKVAEEISEKTETEIIKTNRKTISIQVCSDCHVRVRAPYRMRDAEIAAFIREKSAWIKKHVALMKQRQEQWANEPPVEPLSPQDIRELAEQALRILPDKVRYYAKQIGVDYGRITIRCQKTRWGSCSRKGNLNFNCLLMLAPEEVLDYVIIHELCHRKEMNHSKRFWAEVARMMPDYDEKRRWLKENGERLISRAGIQNVEENCIMSYNKGTI